MHVNPVLLSALAFFCALVASLQAEVSSVGPIDPFENPEGSPGYIREVPEDRIGDGVVLGIPVFLQSPSKTPNRIGIRATSLMNLEVDYLDTSTADVSPGPDTGVVSARTYFNGFLIDFYSPSQRAANPALPNQTPASFAGIRSASQLTGTDASGTLSLNALTFSQRLGDRSDDGNAPGGEVFYAREVAYIDPVFVSFVASFGYNRFESEDRYLFSRSGQLITDTFNRSVGTFEGTANVPLISLDPTRTFSPATLEFDGRQKLETQLYTFTLGPAAEWEALETFRLGFETGALILLASSEFDYSESLILNGSPISNTFSGSQDDFLFGAYGRFSARWDFLDNFSLEAGYRFAFSNEHEVITPGRTARVDFAIIHQLSASLSYRF